MDLAPDNASLIRPADLEGYLTSLGATQVRVIPDRLAIWTVRKHEGDLQVLVPASQTLHDYDLRLDEALSALEIVTDLSRAQVLASILAGSSDLLRIRAQDVDVPTGLIPIEAGVRLVESARSAMTAAACSALQPQMSYPSRKPTGVPEFLERVRLGQTEVGSYVLTVYLPLEEPSLAETDNRLFEVQSVPFGRRVTRTLVTAIDATQDAVAQVRNGRDYDVFMTGVLKGVSANLCRALAKMVEPNAGVESVDMNMTWGRSVPADEPHWAARFSRDDAKVLGVAADLLSGEGPQTGYLTVGPVVGLQRPEGGLAGIVRVSTSIGEKQQVVEMVLSGVDYDAAIEAHKRNVHIVCHGDLVKRGRKHVLDDPWGFGLNAE